MEEILSGFKPLFSRVRAYAWHIVIIIGLMIRSDKLGLTSVIRDLALRPETYEPMLHFFRSDAWDLERVRSKWAEIVGEKFPLFEKAGHCVLVGDGTKQAKEGRHMPGVKKLAQESETQSKQEYLYGHHWGLAERKAFPAFFSAPGFTTACKQRKTGMAPRFRGIPTLWK